MATAQLNTLPDDERESIHSETSAFRNKMADDEMESSTSKKSSTTPKTGPTRRKSAADKRMDCLEKEVDENFNSLLQMMKTLTQSRTGSASASAVQDNNPLGECRPVSSEDNIPLGNRRPLINITNDLNSDFRLSPHSPQRQDQEDLDSVSIAPVQQEKDALRLLSDKEHSDSESHHSEISVTEHPKSQTVFDSIWLKKPQTIL